MRKWEAGAGLALLLALGACGQRADGNGQTADANGSAGATADAPAASAPGGLPMQPGAWEMAIDMQMPDMPPEVRAQLGKQGAITHRVCLTAEALGDANRSFLAGGSERDGTQCDTSGLRIGGNRVDGSISCTGRDGRAMQISMTGTLGATEYEMDQRVEGPQGALASHVVARRVGDCTAEEMAQANADRAGTATQ